MGDEGAKDCQDECLVTPKLPLGLWRGFEGALGDGGDEAKETTTGEVGGLGWCWEAAKVEEEDVYCLPCCR